MSKKSKRSKQKRKLTHSPSQADRLFDLVGHQIFQGSYAEAVTNCERLLNYLPPHASMRADVLAQMGVAHAMLQNHAESYEAWGNLGICLIMQERYDEAEAALRRALAIDPKYSIAKNNLAMLPETRRTGPPKTIRITDTFKGSKTKQSITFYLEK